MNCGGGVGGFIASRDEERYAREYPTLQVSLCPTGRAGRARVRGDLFEQTSYGAARVGKDWTGNSVYLWAIANAVYMALLGPAGFREIGERSWRAATTRRRQHRRHPRPGVRFPRASSRSSSSTSSPAARRSPRSTGRLLERGIFGGDDLSADFTGNSASARSTASPRFTPRPTSTASSGAGARSGA